MNIGFIVGRFQVPDLTPGHIHLISSAIRDNDITVVLIGCLPNSYINRYNPLPYQVRKEMIQQRFPQVTCSALFDVEGDNDKWSKDLDHFLNTAYKDGNDVKLYGSRDSFIKHYTGKWKEVYVEVTEIPDVSGTVVREAIEETHVTDVRSREGMIFLVSQLFKK